jgi:hypothetical protein
VSVRRRFSRRAAAGHQGSGILDACRNNPFSGSVSPNGGYHAVSVGNDGIRLTASGRLWGNRGSGTYSRSDGCAGRWIAAKK